MTPDPVSNFVALFAQIESLIEFDQLILGIPIRLLEKISEAQDRAKIQNINLRVDKPLTLLRNIRNNDSIRGHFQTVYNQCCVLAVSYFTSAARDVFISRLGKALASNPPDTLLGESMTLTVRELSTLSVDSRTQLAEMLILKKDISFQDMQSIHRCFKSYIGIELPRSTEVNDIITGQACRHAIVHTGANVDKRLVNQVRDATPRRIQHVLTQGQSISFTPDEIRTLGTSMVSHLHLLGTM